MSKPRTYGDPYRQLKAANLLKKCMNLDIRSGPPMKAETGKIALFQKHTYLLCPKLLGGADG